MFGGTGRSISRTTARAARVLVLALVLTAFGATLAQAATVNVTAREYIPNGPDTVLGEYTYLVNVDNAKDPQDPDPLNHPGFGGTASDIPVVATGDQDTGDFDLPAGRYLITVRSPDHKMWGKHIVVPDDSNVSVSLRPYPVPRGKIKVIVFNDNHWVNTALDAGETGIAGIHVVLYDEFHNQIPVDADNNPICGGRCVTDSDGFVSINNLGPGLYFIRAIAPKGSGWRQDFTLDGGLFIPIGVEEGADGTGTSVVGGVAELAGLPAGKQTVNQIGMVKEMGWQTPGGTGRVFGTARNDVSWPPTEAVTLEETLDRPYVALSDLSTDAQVWTGRGNRDGTFSIPNVPAGSYFLSVWDEQLSYVIRFVQIDVAAGEQVNVNDLDANGDGLPDNGLGVPRWTGWLEGDVYYDANGNGQKDLGERPVPDTDVDERWRDGSIKEVTMTDRNGHYNYTMAEGGPLGKWFIGEVGFGRFSTTGPSFFADPAFHTPHAADFPAPDPRVLPTDLGGGLLTNQMIMAGHHHVVDWGKKVYAEGETGQIVGVVYHGSTRNEVEARNQGHEDYEPGIADVVVRLKGLGPDNTPNTDDDPTLSEYTTDRWAQPENCEMRDVFGGLVAPGLLNPAITADCLEAPSLSGQTVDGGFDGGFAFADKCPLNPDGSSTFPCAEEDLVPLTAGKYIAQVLMPNDGTNDLYQITKEEDVNVDGGAEFTPAIPQPECVGDAHVVPANDFTSGRGGTAGKTRKLCDQRLVTLKNKQNFNADFYLFTANDIEIPGRVIGLVNNDVRVESDPQAIWYQNKRGEPHVPLGIYDRDPDKGGRLIKTVESDESGEFDVVLPSTETINCPTPAGICPGMYWFVINDPGTKQNPNANYRPDLLTDGIAGQVWPGLTAQLDLPVTPISGDGCVIPGTTPNFLQASRPVIPSSQTGSQRQVTLEGTTFGAGGTVTLDGSSSGQSRTLTSGNAVSSTNGGIVSWSDTQIVIQVPNQSSSFFGTKQLLIHNGDTGDTAQTGLTLHVLRSSGTGTYAPTVTNVGAPTSNAHALQNAINAASAGTVLVLAKGTYNENVIVDKPVVLQGSGPGGIGGVGDTTVPGTSINGAFFPQNAATWRAKRNSTSWSGNQFIAEGAAITVLAPETGSRRFNDGSLPGPARIDGIGIRTAQSGGAGGVQVNGYARNLQITNDEIEGNGGQYAGGIAIGVERGNGTDSQSNNHNEGAGIRFNRVEGNGAFARSGGIGIFYGADNYRVQNNIICSNYSFEYGGGITQYGRSTGGRITDNRIYYNAAFDSGGALAISEQLRTGGVLGTGTGTVDIDRNLIEGNFSGDDGGALYLRSAFASQVNVRENMMVANGSADAGGAILLADSSNVRIVNNTVADNATTGTVETRDGTPHAAGLTSEANNPLWQAQQSGTAPLFSNPVALFNNIFTTNTAYTYNAPDNTLTDRGFMDFEVSGTAGTLRPQRSVLSVAYGPTSPNPNNLIGLDPLFLTAQAPTFLLQAAAADPQFVSVSLTRGALPQGLLGDYHLSVESDAIDRGVLTNNGVTAPNRDIDNDIRPQLRTGRSTTPFDLGADEVPQ